MRRLIRDLLYRQGADLFYGHCPVPMESPVLRRHLPCPIFELPGGVRINRSEFLFEMAVVLEFEKVGTERSHRVWRPTPSTLNAACTERSLCHEHDVLSSFYTPSDPPIRTVTSL